MTLPPTIEASADVHCGRNGWLFLVGGSNSALDYYTGPGAFPDATLQKWVGLLRERRRKCQSFGARYVHMVAPDKLTVYRDEFVDDLPYWSHSPALGIPKAAAADGLADAIIDVVPYLLAQKEHYKLFFQTDTHWTFEGCFCAYQILCSKLGVQFNAEIVSGQRKSAEILLDLGAKLAPPRREEFAMVSFLKNSRRVAVNSLVSYKEREKLENDGGLHIGCNVVFCNNQPEAVDKTVVLFGDSFSEYRPHLLTGMLAETFREVHFVWSTSLDWSYIERVKPDLLITEAAERFANRVPTDDFDLDRHVVRLLADRI